MDAPSQSGHELLREFGAEPVVYRAGLDERVRALAPWRGRRQSGSKAVAPRPRKRGTR
jgi:hypothetical protein